VSALEAAQRWQSMAIDQARLLDLAPRDRIELAVEFYAQLWHEADPNQRIAVYSEAIDLFDRLDDVTEADRQSRARLQAALGEAQFDASQVDAARATLSDGIAALEPGPPTQGRAFLLRTLGWTLWRTGSSSEAIPVLERALSEAVEAGSPEARRWALHDLGLATVRSGRMDAGMEMLEESYELARSAGDRALVARSSINLPLLKSERGDPWTEFVPMYEEGLAQARRDGAHSTACYLAVNLGFDMDDLGRPDEGLSYALESIEAGRRVADAEMTATALECLAWIHLARDEVRDAERTRDEARSLTRSGEGEGWSAALDAVLEWAIDPPRAYERLSSRVERLASDDPSLPFAGRWLARLALRLDDPAGLSRATAVFLAATAGGTGPVLRLRRTWLAGLDHDGDATDVAAAAGELDAAGFRGLAVAAYADAALIAARAGRPGTTIELANRVIAETGFHHALGPVPETRWLAPQPTMRR
jgi:tetratricopeptide (TPR) repeat protein